MNTCQYCHTEISADRKSCEWCSRILQEANCNGLYIVDTATAMSRRDDLSPDQRRAEIQAAYDRLTRR